MKYISYSVYTEDSNYQKTEPTAEFMSIGGITYDKSRNLVVIISPDFVDLLIPISYTEYLSLLRQIKVSVTVEINILGFNRVTEDSFDYPNSVTDEMLEKANDERQSKVILANSSSVFEAKGFN